MGFAGTILIPAEMRHGSPFMQSPFTIGHVVMTLLSGIPWLIAVFLVVAQVKRNPAWQRSRSVCLILAAACVAGLALNVLAPTLPVLPSRPGLAQRISFGIYFAWFLVMAAHLQTGREMPADRRVSQQPTCSAWMRDPSRPRQRTTQLNGSGCSERSTVRRLIVRAALDVGISSRFDTPFARRR